MVRTVGKALWSLLIAMLMLIAVPATAQVSIGDDLSKINYERPSEYVIAAVEVEGVEYLDKNVIIMLSELEVGARINVPGDQITSAIRKLWDQGLFDNISVVATKIQANKIFL
jgi:outer membrane protein insertion porin family